MTTKQIETYRTILDRFVSNPDDLRAWMMSPFNALVYSGATNKYALVLTPKIDESYPDRTDKIEKYVNYPRRFIRHVHVSDLQEWIDNVPMVDGLVDCDVCDGKCDIEVQYEYRDEIYDADVPCPKCDGWGKMNGTKKDFDPEATLRIGISEFNAWRIAELLFVAKEMKVDKINLVREGKNEASIFEIAEVTVFLMPVAQP